MNWKSPLSLRNLICSVSLLGASVWSQQFTADQYKKAAWMTTRFYGGQRSGYNNWLLMSSSNAAYKTSFVKDFYNTTTDVNGGWFDCGDHVMFGQTQFSSAYILAKAYEQFPTGYHDLYNGTDYSDYAAKGSFGYADGTPNGIPDLLDELLFEADFLVKITPNASTFIYQKGVGSVDHQRWVTAGREALLNVSLGGELDGSRTISAQPADASMPSFVAATLAVLSRVMQATNPTLAATFKTHAEYAYQYATNHPGTVDDFGDCNGTNCYKANAKWQDDYATASLEMYKLTNTASYQTSAYNHWSDLSGGSTWGFDYDNNDPLAYYAFATLADDADGLTKLDELITGYMNSPSSEGITTSGNVSWGSMRYVGNVAYLMALYNKASGTTKWKTALYKHIDFLLGANTTKQSFIVGYCEGCSKQPQHPHHRNVYLNNNNPDDAGKQAMVIPTNNKLFGALVGGGNGRTSDIYKDEIITYAASEVCTDYNAGLVGALGAIVAEKAAAIAVRPTIKTALSGFFMMQNGSDYVFSSHNGKPFTVDIINLQGEKVAHLNVTGTQANWHPAAQGLYHAVANSETAHQVFQVAVTR